MSQDSADATRNALSLLTRFKFIFFLPKSIDDNMAKVRITVYHKQKNCRFERSVKNKRKKIE